VSETTTTRAALRPDDVIVEMRAVGICGSDLDMLDGYWVRAQPMVLGHDGAGVVTVILPRGDQRRRRRPRRALLGCGHCVSCERGAPRRCVPVRAAITDGTTRIALDGETGYRMTATASAAMPIPNNLPFEQAALLGCAPLTGTGAAPNTGQIDATTDVVVIGAGGVGQFAIQGADRRRRPLVAAAGA
jgi:Zn-dependent alcohol dehydrogenase